MRTTGPRILLAISAGLLLLAGTATAGIYGSPAPFSGLRSVQDPGLETNDPDWYDVTVRWEIVDNLNGTCTYTYTMLNFSTPALSHLTLDVTDSAVDDPNSITDATLNGVPVSIELGTMDEITGAVKFDDGTESPVVFSFTSNRLPVYGDLFVKAGGIGSGISTLRNTGFYDHASTEALDFIARPNGIVPVPASVALGLFGLAGGWLVRRKRAA